MVRPFERATLPRNRHRLALVLGEMKRQDVLSDRDTGGAPSDSQPTTQKGRMRAAPADSALTWSDQKPTTPGFYWLRHIPQDVELNAADVVYLEPDGRGVMHFFDEAGPQPLLSEVFADTQWAGPLQRPH